MEEDASFKKGCSESGLLIGKSWFIKSMWWGELHPQVILTNKECD
jgi:hypothetical protein